MKAEAKMNHVRTRHVCAIHSVVVLAFVACAVGGGLLGQTSCTQVRHAEAAIIDCTGGGTSGIVANVLSTLESWHRDEASGGCMTASGFDWNCVEQKALAKGEQIGGCAIAELVQSVIGGSKATPVDSSWLARAALEEFRARAAGGATFHTQAGDL